MLEKADKSMEERVRKKIPFICRKRCGNVAYNKSCTYNQWKEMNHSITKVTEI